MISQYGRVKRCCFLTQQTGEEQAVNGECIDEYYQSDPEVLRALLSVLWSRSNKER